MAVLQSTYHRDQVYEIFAKKQPDVVTGVPQNYSSLNCMGLSSDVSGVPAATFYEQRDGSGNLLKKGFFEGNGLNARMYVAGRTDDPTGGTMCGPVAGGIGTGNVVTVHTTGAASYTVTKTWGDASGFGHGAWQVTIGQVALYTSVGGSGAVDEPLNGQSLGFIFVLSTPVQMSYLDQPIFGSSGLQITLTIDL